MQQLQQNPQILALIAVASVLLLATVFVDTARPSNGRSSDPDAPKAFSSPCGTADQVSERAGRCLDEVFKLIEGKYEDPKGDEDIVDHCNRFNRTEKCIRAIARDCLQGVHKTATSAVASATKRFYKSECKNQATRSRYLEPLVCANRNGKEMVKLYRNHTAIMQGIRDIPDITPEAKLIKMCCLLNSMDREIAASFDKICPKHTPIVVSIVRAITEDARSALCVSPKCNHALDSVMRTPYQGKQNLIEPVTQILFQLSVD